MNLEDLLIAPQAISTEKWQLGNIIKPHLVEHGIALIFVSDFRGANGDSEVKDFRSIREAFYQLSKLDFDLPICDLGDLISGKTLQDSHYILQEILSLCHYKNTIPVVIGGSSDFSYSLFAALNFHHKNLTYTHIAPEISLSAEGEEISEDNFLSRIFSTKNFSIKNFHLLGYQKHLNETDSVKLIKEVNFDIVRLADMMNSTERTEPFFRKADLVTVNCDAVESFSEAFSIHPQVNGLNRREICAYMKEVGMSENLKSAAIFNYNFEGKSFLNDQLLAQMIWYLIEGINIQNSHPKERHFETYFLMIDDKNIAFKRDTFTDLWYFGEDESIEYCIPCSKSDYENAKRGILNFRFLRQ